jgi:hypothetical protein
VKRIALALFAVAIWESAVPACPAGTPGAELGKITLQQFFSLAIISSDSGLSPSVAEWKKARRTISALYSRARQKHPGAKEAVWEAVELAKRDKDLRALRKKILLSPPSARPEIITTAAQSMESLLRKSSPATLGLLKKLLSSHQLAR